MIHDAPRPCQACVAYVQANARHGGARPGGASAATERCQRRAGGAGTRSFAALKMTGMGCQPAVVILSAAKDLVPAPPAHPAARRLRLHPGWAGTARCLLRY